MTRRLYWEIEGPLLDVTALTLRRYLDSYGPLADLDLVNLITDQLVWWALDWPDRSEALHEMAWLVVACVREIGWQAHSDFYDGL